MGKPVRIILVSGEHHPLHKLLDTLCREVAEEIGLEYELKLEDYVFLSEYGIKDEFGFAGIPQVFAYYDSGEVKPLLNEFPLDENYKVDVEKTKAIIKDKLRIMKD